jgi:23S rRNA (cytosine1962-C5)-methyltransferase
MDSSGPALEQVARNLALNGFGDCESELMEQDVFTALRKFRDSRKSFDAIILDPPKFAPTVVQVERAARAYKDINLLAFKLLNPGGVLFTFSCSGGVSRDLFQKIVTGAAQDAGVDARILAQLSQGPDHPVSLNFPEGMYLKGLVCAI